MFRIFVVFLAFFSLSWAEGLFTSYTTILKEVRGNTATVTDSERLVVGSSGIVIHRFDESKSTIIARASVINKANGLATVQFEVFDLLEQAAFPLPGVLPKEGDTVILNYLYDRALIVAPNSIVFNEVTGHFKDIQWVHPDLMGAYLASEYTPNPDRDTFRKLCQAHSTGVIFFALNFKGYFADCQSFKVLKTLNSGRISTYQLPFYTRIAGIESAFWKFSSGEISDYNAHYGALLVQ
ncbi:MAG: plasminogen-binding N-terminal domain-containing protein [Campylobacterales bacterium]|nr:plasminogen-binding N-terminal domain-containing protein [Campylobacterales bacterium]